MSSLKLLTLVTNSHRFWILGICFDLTDVGLELGAVLIVPLACLLA